jgi:hypothetical protein
MGLGLILDDICVFIGVAVMWLAKGCKYSLWKKLKKVKAGDFWSHREGIIGLATIFAIVGLIWGFIHFLKISMRH